MRLLGADISKQTKGAALAGAGSLLLFPALAHAHGGVVQRATLPIPEWLFLWAAAIVLFVSFAALAVLWPEPRLDRAPWRPLPGGIGRALASRPVQMVCGAAGVALLALVLGAGWFGAESPTDNLAPTFVFITFWIGLVFVSALFGDVFRAFSPWRAIGRALRMDGIRPYPERLGRWPAAIALFAFTWIELVSGWGDHPGSIANAVAAYTAYTLVMQFVFGTETWTRNGEAFAVYFGLFARLSIFETRDGVVGTRPLLAGLSGLDRGPGITAVVVVMIGTVTFDGFSQNRLWSADAGPWLTEAFESAGVGLETAGKLAGTIGLLLGVLVVALFYDLGIRGTRTVGGDISVQRLRRGFVHSLVPIAMVYAMAHYFSYLVIEGQAIIYLASDPFGTGQNLLGTADAGIDFSVISQNLTWYFQVGFVVLGHVAGLVLAHDRALVLYGHAKQAVRSQYWMLLIMVGFTSLALYLLWKANA